MYLKRSSIVIALAAATWFFGMQAQRPTPPKPPDHSKLPAVSAIEVLFHTNEDDKDFDTALNVDFSCRDSVFSASTFTNQGDFSDNSSTPWVSIPIQSKVFKTAVHNCTTRVHIEPVGRDTWRFNYWVRLHYSDGTMDEYHYDDHALSEKVKENTFPLR